MNAAKNQRWTVTVLLVPLLTTVTCPAHGFPQTSQPISRTDQPISARFDDINLMTARGQFGRAIEALESIIEEYSDDDAVLPRAYNELINVLLNQLNNETDPREQSRVNQNIRAWAREALTLYPDLIADTSRYPSQINLTYDTLREVMFGRVVITSIPDSSTVTIDGVYAGTSPLAVAHYPVGEHELTVTHEGYNERMVTLEVLPGGVVRQEVTLSRQRNKKWWLTRVITPVVVGVGLAWALVAATGKDESPPQEDQPLPEPPPPPTQ